MFAFFGVIAVTGTAYVHMERFSWLALAASVPAGLLACALLIVNNLRDIQGDTLAGKRTLAVRLGTRAAACCTSLTRAGVPLGCAAAGSPFTGRSRCWWP